MNKSAFLQHLVPDLLVLLIMRTLSKHKLVSIHDLIAYLNPYFISNRVALKMGVKIKIN